ncbi:hypothetical protein HN960_05435 [Candidatus Peregrinibacteria bacterium]|jgi:hypothetical protein|nr:hypothetical protein [Candidatus Peregrinibacteria bacterium]MBT7009845.1 hypothetical protein [Candidatus Peregrinibacteria bacterium]
MAYKINGVDISLQPTSAKWIDREKFGFDGAGHPIYAPVREFELQWGIASQEERNQLQLFFDSIAVTGTVVATLPSYRGNTWEFYSYSGCTLSEPINDNYFSEHGTDVVLIIHNIRTE